MNKDELIRRARELAELKKYTTPRPWRVEKRENCYWITSKKLWVIAEIVKNNYRKDYQYTYETDAVLLAAAPEMADLLKKMADALESKGEQP